ncbi:MAG: copper resistance CopC/CopD family protein [Ktedonobacterales bacterium]
MIYAAPLLLAALLWLAWSPTVDAQAPRPEAAHVALHAVLLRSDPAAGSVLPTEPGVVRLWFSEPVQPVSTGIVVLDAAGRRASRGPAQASGTTLTVGVAPAGEGTYFVRWQVISSDTHPLEGQLSFSVGHPSRGPEGFAENAGVSPFGLALQVVSRWLHFAGYALGFGTLAFGLVVLWPLGISERGSAERRIRWLVSGGIALLLVAAAMALMAQVVSLGAGSPFAPSASEIAGDALASGFGRVLSQQLGAALLLWVLVGIAESLKAGEEEKAQAGKERSGGRGERIALLAAVIVGVALAIVDGEASHAVNVEPLWFGLAVNALHVAAMGLWAGGLLALLAVWNTKELRGRRGAMVACFGRIAVSAVVMLSATGVVLAWEQVQRPINVVATSYGWALIAKLLVVAGVLIAAFVARRMRAGDRRFRWWAVEVAGVAVVLALAGLLASLAPPV